MNIKKEINIKGTFNYYYFNKWWQVGKVEQRAAAGNVEAQTQCARCAAQQQRRLGEKDERGERGSRWQTVRIFGACNTLSAVSFVESPGNLGLIIKWQLAVVQVSVIDRFASWVIANQAK